MTVGPSWGQTRYVISLHGDSPSAAVCGARRGGDECPCCSVAEVGRR